MGYVRERKVFKLKFADEDMGGLEVRVRSMSLGRLLEAGELPRNLAMLAGNKEKSDLLLGMLVEHIVEWNLEEPRPDLEGCPLVPVPVTLDSMYAQEHDFVASIIAAWFEAVVGVSAPLGKTSSDGSQSLEASIPMEPLSQNLVS